MIRQFQFFLYRISSLCLVGFICTLDVTAQFIANNVAVYERRFLNASNGFNYKNINHLEFDKDSGIWCISDGRLLSYKDGTAKQCSRLVGGKNPNFYRPSYFLRTTRGDLFCQNEKFIVRVGSDQKLSFFIDKSVINNLFLFSERNTFTNYANMLEPYYYFHLGTYAIKHHRKEYELGENNDKIRVLSNHKYETIGTYKGKFKGEAVFGDTTVSITTKGIYLLGDYKWSKEVTIKVANSHQVLLAENIYNVFYGNHSFYLVTTEGFFQLSLFGEDLIAIKIIGKENFAPQSFKCMLAGPNNNWFLFGGVDGLYEYTKTGMNLLSTKNTVQNSANALLWNKGRLYTNSGGYWDQKGKFFLDSKNPLIAYPDNYIKVNNRCFLAFKNYETRLVDTNFNIIKKFQRLNYYNCLTTDEKGNIYEINMNNFSIWTGDSFKNLDFDFVNRDDLDIMYASLVSNDTFYVTSFGGVIRYQMGNRKPLPTLIPELTIRNVQKGFGREGVYAFTDGGGVFLIHGEKVRKVPVDPKNYMRNAHYFYLDRHKRVWIPTNFGMLIAGYDDMLRGINDSTHRIQYFYYTGPGPENFTEFNGSSKNASWFDSTFHRLYFCSVDGIVHVNPDLFSPIFPIQSPVIISTEKDGVKTDGFAIPELGFENLILQLGVTTIGFPQDIVKEYRIQGENESWIPVNNLNQIILIRKKTGLNKLEFRLRNGLGPSDYQYVSWTYYVKPYWYEKPIFYVCLILALIAFVWGLLKWRARKHVQMQKELEEIILIKTQEISKNLNDLQISENQLRNINMMKEKLINVLAHDIRSPLISTFFVSEHVLDKLKGQTDITDHGELLQMLEQVSRTIKSVYTYANDFLVWYNFHQGNVRPIKTLINLSQTLIPTIDMYLPVIKSSGNSLKLILDEGLEVNCDAKVLSIVFRNLLDNANKNTTQGEITIQLIQKNDCALMIFENCCEDLNQDTRNFMDRRLLEDFSNSTPKEGELLGLRMIAFFSKILSIELSLQFIEPNIVHFELKIPLNKRPI